MSERLAMKRLPSMSVPGFPNATTAAQAVLTRALEFSARELSLDSPRAAAAHLRRGDQTARGRFQYGIAQLVAEYLGNWDAAVRAVYVYELYGAREDWVGSPGVPLLHLIIWSQPKTAALHSLIAALDRALAQGLSELLGVPPPVYVLDVQLIDDAEVEARLGYAALLFSPHYRPAGVWSREDMIPT